ncbi:hypothetical protein CALCODRAFT_499434 [Calocera cornea HHB12733]|uniref:Uncharacterized protein n=1 Tax=Calocera cornea HHB12733 TaxID=1353952 RepID=A0A165EF83_9BASI|nr:hypothetical protein CALCODRAFT_499434 [Calocera cornea HHB12733]
MTTLESVLYVKGQVPMSVQQMNFLGESGKNVRAAKKRVDLLQTLDVLSSHLTTTFVQLSAALARRCPPPGQGETGRAHVMITLGPPGGLARERVLLEIDGLELKDWARVAEPESEFESESEEDEEEASDDDDDEEEEEDAEEEASDCSELEANSSEESDEPASADEEAHEHSVSGSPPRALAPASLSSASSSRESSLSPLNSPCPIRVLPLPRAQRPPPDPARMLALALINLNQSQALPGRVHLLLRAPRRFEHVAWEARQGMSRALEGACFGFGGEGAKGKKAEPERITVITTHPPSSPPPAPVPAHPTRPSAEEEEDEPLWFEWTGKLQGFMEI